jgi:membrane-associated phospholipid phosphatase
MPQFVPPRVRAAVWVPRRIATTLGSVRRPTAVRAAAVAVLAAGLAAPLLRRRLGLRPPVVLGTAAATPFALSVLVPRTRARDVVTCVLQMYAYVTAYKMPYDDPDALARRVRVAYPVTADRVLGGGVTPTLRLQRALGTPGSFKAWEKLLVWSHWVWFAFPHGTVLYLLLRRPDRFPTGAARIYATFDIGLVGYWAVPTAPPWYAAAEGLMEDGRTPELRRMMVEYGEHFWRSGWAPLYGVLGGNPLAAMPSLHFATSVSAAHVLAETGALAGTVGWIYTALLGTALVYLGEHYVVDLVAGLVLAEGVRAAAPAAAPLARTIARVVQATEARALA